MRPSLAPQKIASLVIFKKFSLRTMTSKQSTKTQSTYWMPLWLFGAWLLIAMGWWGAAFYQLPQTAPGWLARAQAICFGLGPSGLPETYGWWELVLAPLSLLVALWAVWGRDFLVIARTLLKRWPWRLAVGLMAIAVVTEVGWISLRIMDGLSASRIPTYAATAGPFPTTYPRTHQLAPQIPLTDASAKPFRLENLRGSPVVLTFAYGLCDTICPVLVHRAKEGLLLAKEHNPQLVVVTLDPWRDRVSALPGIAKQWKLETEATLLSGSVESVEAVLDAYRIPRSRDPYNGEVAHPPLVFIIDPFGRLAYTLSNPSPQWMAEAVRRVMEP